MRAWLQRRVAPSIRAEPIMRSSAGVCDNAAMRKLTGKSRCAVARGDVDLASYETLDTVWRDLGLAAPARRALVDANILTLAALTRRTRTSISSLHGMGPSAIKLLEREMRRKGVAFRK